LPNVTDKHGSNKHNLFFSPPLSSREEKIAKKIQGEEDNKLHSPPQEQGLLLAHLEYDDT
jgi:hypothetical protein